MKEDPWQSSLEGSGSQFPLNEDAVSVALSAEVIRIELQDKDEPFV